MNCSLSIYAIFLLVDVWVHSRVCQVLNTNCAAELTANHSLRRGGYEDSIWVIVFNLFGAIFDYFKDAIFVGTVGPLLSGHLGTRQFP